MGSTPGSFARTRLIFMPHRDCHWALRILHLVGMPAISPGTPSAAPSRNGDCANEKRIVSYSPISENTESGSSNRHG